MQGVAGQCRRLVLVGLWAALPGCQCGGTEQLDPAPEVAARANDNYAEALEVIDRQLQDARELAVAHGGWADHELVAHLQVRRARLTGAIEDWLAADLALDAGFALAPTGGGPVYARLELDLSLHRLAQAKAGIAAIEAAPLRTAAMDIQLATARGEWAAQRGELDAARQAYADAGRLGADPAVTAGRLALLARRRGDHEGALAGFAKARAGAGALGQGAAWVLLQMGLVEWSRGRPDVALTHYEAAERAFPGWWLVTEHRAEALAGLGRHAEAESLYREVIERTGHPEFMDALAELLLSRRRDDEARQWIAAARREHERRLLALPEGAGAHALDHLIRFAPDEPRTLELATRVAELAPNEDNLGRLAELMFALGQLEAATQTLARARRGGADSRELDQLTRELARAPAP